MTGAPPVPNRSALWAALSNMQIQVAEAEAGFEQALAWEQAWAIDFAERVTDEYRRFLYLAATAGFEVTPSRTVDEAWHLHLRQRHYDEMLCGQILGRPLEHRPAAGEPGEEERHRSQYEKTLQLYERAFLRPPPSDIWPAALSQSELQAEERRLRNGKLARGAAAGTALAAVVALLIGRPLIALFLAVVAGTLGLLADALFPRRKRPGGSAGCGGNCGGGSDASDGGGSCGGGCGGD